MCICPFCGTINSEDDDGLAYTDYVDQYIMLWCNGCEARSVYDLNIQWEADIDKYLIFDSQTDSEVTGKMANFVKDRFSSSELILKIFRVPLVKIKRVIDDGLAGSYSDKPVREEKVRKFIDNNYRDVEGILQVSPEKQILEYSKMSFNVSLPCESYDATRPLKDYSKHMSILDGSVTLLLLENGEKMSFWGTKP